uniref:Uncharacterized protein n=1 Tax=Rhizobium rhizogenes TaxID=359 RepID=A0A7S5DRS5_RHIRH|nr:hypothetical protein pC5.7c_623 [Rhizobium rhizogenes]
MAIEALGAQSMAVASDRRNDGRFPPCAKLERYSVASKCPYL